MTRSLLIAALAAALATGSAAAQGRPNPHRDLRGLPCTACHTTGSWRDVRFDHRSTGYPLRGQHIAAPCAGCHDVGDFHAAVRTCGSCHQDPHRGDAGADCVRCHSESGWRNVNPQDAHARSRLPDLGVHAALRCEDCHPQTGVQPFHSRVTHCVTCHQAQYAATTDPPHATLGIPTDCEQCHQMNTWSFALFPQHDAIFPIYSGSHAHVWSNCTSCHPNSGDYSVFTCTSCHTQGPTTQSHQGIPGYTWDSNACISCHPTGTGGDVSFHEGIFPIFSNPGHGGAWTDCAQCHVDPAVRQNVSCITGGCHTQTATDPGHQGIPGYAYATPQCRSCHPDGRGGTFAQHDVIFPIFTGAHANRWTDCTTCHPDPSSRQVFTCMSGNCHPSGETNSHHQGMSGYSYTPQACLGCHPDGRKP